LKNRNFLPREYEEEEDAIWINLEIDVDSNYVSGSKTHEKEEKKLLSYPTHKALETNSARVYKRINFQGYDVCLFVSVCVCDHHHRPIAAPMSYLILL
jgi:hypothetical protein